MTQEQQTVIIIGGPTASGKSALALALASALNGVVINADSMQLYDDLPLLTAQPEAQDLAKAPHVLYGVLHPSDTCSAARWRDMALAEIEKCRVQGKTAIIAGGTGFYISALLKGLSPMPEVPEHVRADMMDKMQRLGKEAFFAELENLDPVITKTIDRHNPQRLVRAMEVCVGTGKPLSYWQSLPPAPPPEHIRFITVTLLPERDVLYERCDTRFLHMLDIGAKEEALAFESRMTRENITKDAALTHALGWQDIVHWAQGHISRDEMIVSAQTQTRHYAKRQVTWFTRQMQPDVTLKFPDIAPILTFLKN